MAASTFLVIRNFVCKVLQKIKNGYNFPQSNVMYPRIKKVQM